MKKHVVERDDKTGHHVVKHVEGHPMGRHDTAEAANEHARDLEAAAQEREREKKQDD